MIPFIATTLLLPAAFAVHRHSALLARALWLAFGVALVYLALAHAYPLRWKAEDFEWLRWVSAATGLAGAWELTRRATSPSRKYAALAEEGLRQSALEMGDNSPPSRWWPRVRTDLLAALFLGSMAADGVVVLLARAGHPWGPMPVFQVAGLLLVILVSLWPRKWPPAKGWW